MPEVSTQNQKSLDKNPPDKRKTTVSSKWMKSGSARGPLRHGDENLDPCTQTAAKETPTADRGARASRLPVPIKFRRPPQTQTDLSESQTTKGKVQKRPCTKPVPFSLSQPRVNSSVAGTQKEAVTFREPGKLLNGGQSSRVRSLHTTASSSALRAAVSEAKPSAAAPVLKPDPPGVCRPTHEVQEHFNPPSRGAVRHATPAHGICLLQEHRPSQCPPDSRTCLSLPKTLTSCTHSSQPGHGVGEVPSQAVCTKAQLGTLPPRTPVDQTPQESGPEMAAGNQKVDPVAENAPAEEALPQDCFQTPHMRERADHQVAKAGGTGRTVTFQPDPAALRSILDNEGVMTGGHPGSATQVFTCPAQRGRVYTPQRVPVKSQRGAGATTGSTSQFSPNPVALASILRNEGVCLGETSRASVLPPARGSSIYLPQRVPVTKARGGAVGVATVTGPMQASSELCRTPLVGCMPQRVLNTRPQSMRKLLLAHRTPVFRDTPSLKRAVDSSPELKNRREAMVLWQEDVVQRLFEDGEQDADAQGHAEGERAGNSLRGGCSGQETRVDALSNIEDKTGQDGQLLPFFQAPHRGSVIVFAQGHRVKNLLVQQADAGLCALDQLGPRGLAVAMQEERPDRPCVAPSTDVCRQTPSATSRTTGGTMKHQHRIRALEEVLMDEECAMYTSRASGPASQHPRCGNPVASTLDFQDSVFFVPVVLPTQHVSVLLASDENGAVVSGSDSITDATAALCSCVNIAKDHNNVRLLNSFSC